MAETVLVGIDVGKSKVCTLIGEVSRGGDVNIIGYGIAPSVGMKKGMVANIDQTVNSIAASLEKAERLSGYKISSAFVAVGGSHISSQNSRGVVAVSGTSAGSAARTWRAPPRQPKVIGSPPTARSCVIPRGYIVGGEGIRDQLGMSGQLGSRRTSWPGPRHQSRTSKVHRQRERQIDELVISSHAAAEATRPTPRRAGGDDRDIGGGTTDLAIFTHGAVTLPSSPWAPSASPTTSRSGCAPASCQ